ncbi:autophagy-related protein 8c-like protein [Tanacetum coccineum]|uniref:Autophagy-related protein 8c-like protein n=1 Tax=Tanacetum coccineum TaxID=301880 RepID=A0ABQ5G1Y0_9ASTR
MANAKGDTALHIATRKGCVQVIVDKVERSDILDIDKKKYLIPADLTVGQFVYVAKIVGKAIEKEVMTYCRGKMPGNICERVAEGMWRHKLLKLNTSTHLQASKRQAEKEDWRVAEETRVVQSKAFLSSNIQRLLHYLSFLKFFDIWFMIETDVVNIGFTV